MYIDYFCVNNNLCFGTTPSNDEIEELSKHFDLIIALEYPEMMSQL